MPNTGKYHMIMHYRQSSRRAFLGKIAVGASAFTAGGAFANDLTRTLTTNEGPFNR